MNYILMLDHEQPKEIQIDFNLVKRVLDKLNISFSYKYYEDEDRIHTYEIYCDNGIFEIFISRDNDSITLDGDWGETLNFVIAFKNTITPKQKLLFFDQGYNDSMVIESTTNILEIKKVFENH